MANEGEEPLHREGTSHMALNRPSPYEPHEEHELLGYLTSQYRNVFTTEAIHAHLNNHVGYPAAEYGLGVVAQVLREGARILDVGAGFGSFVLLAREAGFDAFGAEIAKFEVDFARRRLARLRPQDDPERVYQQADATRLSLSPNSIDAVTLWNVLEHVDDLASLMQTTAMALKPGGYIFIVCPNYAAERLEAHYHVPWKPELQHDRGAAAAYLRSLGRDSSFFETSVFCRTNEEVLGLLRRLGFELFDLDGFAPMSLSLKNLPRIVSRWRQFRAFHDPQRPSVVVGGRKPQRRSAA